MAVAKAKPVEEIDSAVSEDRELAQAQLKSADEKALAVDKDEIKTGKIEFRGEKFHVADEVGTLPFLLFAAAQDMPADGPDGMAAIWHMIEDVLHEKDYPRFLQYALKLRPKVTADELLELMNKAQEIIAGTPTAQPDGSSGS
jgi:hypothetical protein